MFHKFFFKSIINHCSRDKTKGKEDLGEKSAKRMTRIDRFGFEESLAMLDWEKRTKKARDRQGCWLDLCCRCDGCSPAGTWSRRNAGPLAAVAAPRDYLFILLIDKKCENRFPAGVASPSTLTSYSSLGLLATTIAPLIPPVLRACDSHWHVKKINTITTNLFIP